jgi:transposase
MENPRRPHAPQEKVAILRRYLIDKKPVADLCDEFHLHPTVFYRWLKTFFDNGALAFQPDSTARREHEPQRRCVASLEERLRTRNEILAQLLEENLAPKDRLPQASSDDRPNALKTPARRAEHSS